MKKHILALATIFTLGTGIFSSNALAAKHTIQSGDTLLDISKQYSMTVDELKKLNDLSTDVIYENNTLKVITDSDFYTIQPGDTLYHIALGKGLTTDQLALWNNLVNPDFILAGDELAVSAEASEFRNKVAAPVTEETVQPKQSGQVSNEPTQKKSEESNTQAQSKPAAQSQQAEQPQQTSQPQGKTITVTATAYTANCSGCSGVTANGTDLRTNPNVKVIAVDPSVIPLGTKVYVEGYGEAIAADTGGAIKGNKIDVFIPTEQDALNWGSRTVQVTILN